MDVLKGLTVSGQITAGTGDVAVTDATGYVNPAAEKTALAASIKTGAYTVAAGDTCVPVDCTAGGVTVTIPLAATFTGPCFTVDKIDSTSNVLTINPTSTDTLGGYTSIQVSVPGSLTFWKRADGAGWHVG